MDKHNKNEKTIMLRPTVDYRDPEQTEPRVKEWYEGLVQDALLRGIEREE